MRQAMILCAGLGTRMKPITDKIPKPMITINNKKIVDRIIEGLIEKGVVRIVVNTFYLSDIIEEHIAKKYKNSKTEVILHKEEDLLETGGSLLNAINKKYFDCEEPIILINGDSVFFPSDSIPVEELFSVFKEKETLATMLLKLSKDRNVYGIEDKPMYVLDNRTVNRASDSATGTHFYAGISLINPKIFTELSKEYRKFRISELFKKYSPSGRITGIEFKNTIFHIDTPEKLAKYKIIIKNLENNQ